MINFIKATDLDCGREGFELRHPGFRAHSFNYLTIELILAKVSAVVTILPTLQMRKLRFQGC